MQVSIDGYIHCQRLGEHESRGTADVIGDHRFLFLCIKDAAFLNYVLVCPYTVVFDLPDNWSPVSSEIDMLVKLRKNVSDAMFEKITEIDKKISKLQSIEYQTDAQ